jgi:hypothetical protein
VLPENQWIKRIDLQKYQAFIPLPYFHIGSENIWIDGGCNIISQSFAALKNSGLPSMGVLLSRTSLSQTIENVSLMLGPTCDQLNMERFPSHKPFLLMVAPCNLLNERDKQIIMKAVKVDSSGTFYLYDLPFNAFRTISDSQAIEVSLELKDSTLFEREGFFVSQNNVGWTFVDYDSLNNGIVMNGMGSFTGKAKNKNHIFNRTLPDADTVHEYRVSFWMNNISGDLYPRTIIRINEYSNKGTLLESVSYPVFKNLVTIDKDKALVEIHYRFSDPHGRLDIILNNKTLRNKPLQIDDLLIRPADMNIYRKLPNATWKNNRIYPLCGKDI